MAVVTTKSAAITARDANTAGNSRNTEAVLRKSRGMASAVSGDSIASKYVLCSVPSNAVVGKVELTCSAITTCAGDVGLYRNTRDGGAVVSVAFFKAAASLATALSGSNITYDNVLTKANAEKPLWEALSLTSDPGVIYDVVVTLTAAAGSAGTVMTEVEYTI